MLESHMQMENAALQRSVTVAKPKKVLRMVQNDRTAGSIPVWSAPTSPAKTNDALTAPLQAALSPYNKSEASFQNALALHNPASSEANSAEPEASAAGAELSEEEEFGFGDLIDIINPLHHIPLLGSVYREISGDEIKPIGKILGGGIFGGAIGAASGLVNVIIEEETGRDIAGNAFAFAMNGEAPKFKSTSDTPETRLGTALADIGGMESDFPASLLSFSNSGKMDKTRYAAYRAEQERSIHDVVAALSPREEISSLPAKYNPSFVPDGVKTNTQQAPLMQEKSTLASMYPDRFKPKRSPYTNTVAQVKTAPQANTLHAPLAPPNQQDPQAMVTAMHAPSIPQKVDFRIL